MRIVSFEICRRVARSAATASVSPARSRIKRVPKLEPSMTIEAAIAMTMGVGGCGVGIAGGGMHTLLLWS